MPKWLSDFLQTKQGNALGIAFAVLAVGLGGYFLLDAVFGAAQTERLSTGRIYIDSETGKTFGHTVELGETTPVIAPSGKKTGYPAEACYWTAAGTSKTEPTYVLLNATVGKPGPTFCPDCKRLVVPLNPLPLPGDKPPPTNEEMKNRR